MAERRNKTVHVRISSTEHQRLVNCMNARGFNKLSDYVRFLAFDKDLLFDMKFNEIYKIIISKEGNKT